jgi:DNA-binding transcriptional LysR family regulator
MGKEVEKLNVVATYNLVYSVTFLVEEGMGYAVCIDHFFEPYAGNSLRFIPFEPCTVFNVDLIWKKHQVFSKASQKFLERLKEILNIIDDYNCI